MTGASKPTAGNEANLTEADMVKLRAVQLELLRAFDQFCRRHGLPYYAIAGTALGAIRHRGFIPWDDDVDLAMPRDAFDHFVRVAPHEIDGRYFVQHHSTDANFPLPMAKLRRNDSQFAEEAVARVSMHQGIFIDIFPIDRKPSSAMGQRAHFSALMALSRMARLRSGYDLRVSHGPTVTLLTFARVALHAIPMRALTRVYEALLKVFRNGGGPLTIAGGTYGYRREWFDPLWLEETEARAFEDQTVPVFAAVDVYLTHLYGDYMVLPPKSQQTSPHRVALLQFPHD